MFKVSIILFVFIIGYINANCFEEPDKIELVPYRYQTTYNNAQWGEYSQMFTKDFILGGPNFPLIQGNSNWVEACISLHSSTSIRFSYVGEVLNMRENIGTITSMYAYYFPGKEEEIVEIGYVQAFLVKTEGGKWKFDNLIYNKIGKEYSISANWWGSQNF